MSMYCPLCGAEYRPGFTACSDCQVDLVPEPPRQAFADAATNSGPFVLVWSGNDLRKHAEICEALDRQKIPVRTLGRQDHLFGASMHPDFEVLVPSDLKNSAREALNQVEVAQLIRIAPNVWADNFEDEDVGRVEPTRGLVSIGPIESSPRRNGLETTVQFTREPEPSLLCR
jgi:hypothetical protein